jgi:hypothetical protein
MRWFRFRRRRWSGVALLALALQLGLSFGHLHAHAHHPAFIAASDAPAGAATAQPLDNDDEHESHYCAIYAVNALLSGAQVAAAPVIPAVVARAAPDVPSATAAVCLRSRHAAFRSRAPPLS